MIFPARSNLGGFSVKWPESRLRHGGCSSGRFLIPSLNELVPWDFSGKWFCQSMSTHRAGFIFPLQDSGSAWSVFCEILQKLKEEKTHELEAWILPAESSQWIQTSSDSGPAIRAEPTVVESFHSKCSSDYNTTNIWGSVPASFHVPVPLWFTSWAQAAGSSASGNFSRSSCTIPAAVFSPVWEISELEWSCYALRLSVKMLSNWQRTGDQREQFQFVLWILF